MKHDERIKQLALKAGLPGARVKRDKGYVVNALDTAGTEALHEEIWRFVGYYRSLSEAKQRLADDVARYLAGYDSDEFTLLYREIIAGRQLRRLPA